MSYSENGTCTVTQCIGEKSLCPTPGHTFSMAVTVIWDTYCMAYYRKCILEQNIGFPYTKHPHTIAELCILRTLA